MEIYTTYFGKHSFLIILKSHKKPFQNNFRFPEQNNNIHASFPEKKQTSDRLIMTIKTIQNSLYCEVIRIFSPFIMPLDINKYRKYVNDFDLEEDKKVELLQTVWSIMESFVDKAFGQHPVQQCRSNVLKKDLQSHEGRVESHQSEQCKDAIASKAEQKNESNRIRKEKRPHAGPKKNRHILPRLKQ